jgi:hypothetical protein
MIQSHVTWWYVDVDCLSLRVDQRRFACETFAQGSPLEADCLELSFSDVLSDLSLPEHSLSASYWPWPSVRWEAECKWPECREARALFVLNYHTQTKKPKGRNSLQHYPQRHFLIGTNRYAESLTRGVNGESFTPPGCLRKRMPKKRVCGVDITSTIENGNSETILGGSFTLLK